MRSIIAVVIVVAVAIAGAWWWYANHAASTRVATNAPAAPAMAMPVESVPVRIGTAQRQIVAVGTLRSNESITVRPEVAGRIVELNLPEGQRVRRGHVLVRLDSAVERAELAQAEAALQLARANNQRAEELTRTGAGAQRSFDETRARLRNDEATLAFRRARLEKMSIEAPFDGVLGLRRISVGEFVNAGADLVNLEMVDPLKVDFRVPEVFLAAVAPGQEVGIVVDAFPDRPFRGEVAAIDPAIDPGGRAIVIRARIPNTDDVLRPGLFARVTLTLATRPNAIFVPNSAIVPLGERHSVFKVVNGRAVQTPVRLGERSRNEVEILEGLTPQDVVVTAGQNRLRDGVPVRVVPPAEPTAPAAGAPTAPAARPAAPAPAAPAQARG